MAIGCGCDGEMVSDERLRCCGNVNLSGPRVAGR